MNHIDARNGDTPRSRESRRFLHFLAAGGLAAAANFCSRIMLSRWLAFTPAVALAYLVGLATAFVLFRRFVFARSNKPLRQQIFWFAVVNLAAMLQTVLISLLLAEVLLPRLHIVRHVHEIAHAAGIVAPVFTSYLGHKWLSFASKPGNGGRHVDDGASDIGIKDSE